MRTIKAITADLKKRGFKVTWNSDWGGRSKYTITTPIISLASKEVLKPAVYDPYGYDDGHYGYGLVGAEFSQNGYCCAYDDTGGWGDTVPKHRPLLKDYYELVFAKNKNVHFLTCGVPFQREYWEHKYLLEAGFKLAAKVPTRHHGQRYKVGIYTWTRSEVK